jgi:hypothetical protein
MPLYTELNILLRLLNDLSNNWLFDLIKYGEKMLHLYRER